MVHSGKKDHAFLRCELRLKVETRTAKKRYDERLVLRDEGVDELMNVEFRAAIAARAAARVVAARHQRDGVEELVREELDGAELDHDVPAPFRWLDEYGRDERLRAAAEAHRERVAAVAKAVGGQQSARGKKRSREETAEERAMAAGEQAMASDRKDAEAVSQARGKRSKRFEAGLRLRQIALYAELAELNERRLVQELLEEPSWGNVIAEALHKAVGVKAEEPAITQQTGQGRTVCEVYADMVYAANYAKTRVLARQAAAEPSPGAMAMAAMRPVLVAQREWTKAATEAGEKVSLEKQREFHRHRRAIGRRTYREAVQRRKTAARTIDFGA